VYIIGVLYDSARVCALQTPIHTYIMLKTHTGGSENKLSDLSVNGTVFA